MRRWAPAAPLLAAAVLAGVLVGSVVDRWLIVSVRPWLLALVAGVLSTGVWLAFRWVRNRQDRQLDAVRDQVRAEERSAHQRFVQRLHHELKNPITAIRSALATCGENSPELAVIGGQARRVGTLVGDLAKLADLETRPIDREAVGLSEVVAEAVELLPDGGEVRVDFPDVPWPVPPVSGDRDLLSVVVFNLLSNARKYAEPDVTIDVRATETGGFVRLEVSDTGWGIAPQDQAQVWEELARGTHRRQVEGAGLGLSIVRLIVERHGGSVDLRSQPGVGTRIGLLLPAARPAGQVHRSHWGDEGLARQSAPL